MSERERAKKQRRVPLAAGSVAGTQDRWQKIAIGLSMAVSSLLAAFVRSIDSGVWKAVVLGSLVAIAAFFIVQERRDQRAQRR